MSFALEKNNLRKYHGVMLAFRCMMCAVDVTMGFSSS